MYQTQMRPHLSENAHCRLIVRVALEARVIFPVLEAISSNNRRAPRGHRAFKTLGFRLPASLALDRRRHTRRRHSSARA
jgi:hypothetical protein